ncbi:hypothetical protein CTI12_AA406990 [Artemisia annua]|uniref:Uncharacterized protein n=1 Tax=Artemisia annua TaxID=35608 RepID=A0A2U1M8P9_ARTAN|nr:hypothetical protein CTI12_AA406990 [Artemisia annua]
MSSTSMEIWLAQIQAMFKRHRLEIEEIIDARMDNIMNHIQSLNKNDPSKKDKVEEGTSAKEAKEGSYQEADNVKDKESSVKKEKNKQPKVRPTRVQPKPQLQNRVVKAAVFWKKFVISTSQTIKGVDGMICGHSWDKQKTQAAWKKPFIGLRFGSNGGYNSGPHYCQPIRRESQRMTWDPGITII